MKDLELNYIIWLKKKFKFNKINLHSLIRNITLIFLCFLLFSCDNEVQNEIKQRPLYEHPYYEDDDRDLNDSILIPQIIETRIVVNNIQGLETNNEFYNIEAQISQFSDYTEPIIDKYGDTIFNPLVSQGELIFKYDENETFYSEVFSNIYYTWEPDEEYSEPKYGIPEDEELDSTWLIEETFDVKMFHNWDLRKYPFDKQKLKIVLRAFNDTTLVRFKESSINESFFSEVNDLQQGFKITDIDFKEEFYSTGDVYINIPEVVSQGVYEIVISRNGIWVFIKLFFAGILALILSWLVFLIPVRDFQSRVELSIGAVFAAVGNKYFVDSATDSQVLTVADIFNNIIILLVVLNVALVIIKRNRIFTNKKLNDTNSMAKISIITALVLFSSLIIYTIV